MVVFGNNSYCVLMTQIVFMHLIRTVEHLIFFYSYTTKG